jgi:hypothetical protein
MGAAGGVNSLTVLTGSGVTASWAVSDLFLLETAAQDIGERVQAPVLVSYCAAYARAIGQLWRFLSAPTTNTATITARVSPGMVQYPDGSGVYFYGVRVDLTIEELI